MIETTNSICRILKPLFLNKALETGFTFQNEDKPQISIHFESEEDYIIGILNNSQELFKFKKVKKEDTRLSDTLVKDPYFLALKTIKNININEMDTILGTMGCSIQYWDKIKWVPNLSNPNIYTRPPLWYLEQCKEEALLWDWKLSNNVIIASSKDSGLIYAAPSWSALNVNLSKLWKLHLTSNYSEEY
jgi:hypothetical protein